MPVVSSQGPPWPRRLFHAAVGTAIPVVGYFLSDPLPVLLIGILAAGSLALDLIRFRTPWLNRIFLYWLSLLLKKEEEARITGATYLLIAACISFLVFDKEIAIAVLLFLSLGDPAAALIGKPIPGPRILGKSPVGTVAFVGAAMLVVAALVTAGVLEFHWVLVAAAVVAGLTELAPLPLDDNLTVPLISGACAQYLPHLWQLGGLLQ
jgi:dolichol kinase